MLDPKALAKRFKHLATTHFNETQRIRRHLHANPELSFEEHNTAAFVKQTLDDLGIEVQTGVAGTGLVGLIHGQEPSKGVMALRADMDALPIHEQNEVSYKSTVPGVMHACGHDVHTASLLGAARILQETRTEWSGTVKLIFQPGEERIPGGASLMINDGVLQNPSPTGIIGQHVMPLIPAGKVGFRPGLYMASADELRMVVKGKGGHAAMPEFNVDPVLITSHIIVALQQIVSRHASPKIPSVLSFGKVIAEGATNIIPNEVHVEGTFRTFDEAWRSKAHQNMVKMATSIAEGMGGSVEFEVKKGYPFLKNNEALTLRSIEHARTFLGEENVVDLDMWLAAEDFAYFSQAADACFYRLGVRNEARGITSSVHTPTFDIDESALEVGAGLMAWLAVNELAKG